MLLIATPTDRDTDTLVIDPEQHQQPGVLGTQPLMAGYEDEEEDENTDFYDDDDEYEEDYEDDFDKEPSANEDIDDTDSEEEDL